MDLKLWSFPDTGAGLRSIQDDDGLPLFVASDVAAILGYRMASDMTRRLDDDEKGTRSVRTPGGDQVMTVITEPGLYSAIIGSKIPQARAFKRWVTHEVLPTLRRTGRYEIVPTVPDIPRTYAQALRAAVEAEEARELAQAELAIVQPKAESWDYLASSEGDLSVSDAAKILSRDPAITIGRGRLFDHMHAERWVYRQKSDGRWRAYQTQVDAKRLTEMPQSFEHPDTGERTVSTPQVRITLKGLHELHRRLGGVRQLQLPAGGAAA